MSEEEEAEEEVEEDMLWIQGKALNLVEFTGTVAQAIPGPRVGDTKLPWMLAVPLTYAVTTLVTAVVTTVNKLSSPKAQRKKLVSHSVSCSLFLLCSCSLFLLCSCSLFCSLFHSVLALCFYQELIQSLVFESLQMNQNAMICKSIDELLQREGTVSSFELKALEEKV